MNDRSVNTCRQVRDSDNSNSFPLRHVADAASLRRERISASFCPQDTISTFLATPWKSWDVFIFFLEPPPCRRRHYYQYLRPPLPGHDYMHRDSVLADITLFFGGKSEKKNSSSVNELQENRWMLLRFASFNITFQTLSYYRQANRPGDD